MGERLYAEVHTAEAEREYLKAQKTVETLKSALGSTLNSEESVAPASDMFTRCCGRYRTRNALRPRICDCSVPSSLPRWR